MLPKKYDDLAMQCETMGDANKTALHRKRKDIVEIEVNLITWNNYVVSFLIFIFFSKKDNKNSSKIGLIRHIDDRWSMDTFYIYAINTVLKIHSIDNRTYPS